MLATVSTMWCDSRLSIFGIWIIFIKQSLSYFFWKWPYKSEVIKMDRPEIIANKGYETFGEHFFNAGAKQEREKAEAERREMAKGLRDDGVAMEIIVRRTGYTAEQIASF